MGFQSSYFIYFINYPYPHLFNIRLNSVVNRMGNLSRQREFLRSNRGAVLVLLPGIGIRDGRESAVDAADRRGIYAASVLWESEDSGLSGTFRAPGKPEAGTAFNATDGVCVDSATEEDKRSRTGAQGVSVSVAWD